MDIQEWVPLAPLTNYKIGGPARYFAVASSIGDVQAGLNAAKERSAELLVLASGTNMVLPDELIDRFVLKIAIGGVEIEGTTATAGAGESMAELVKDCVNAGLGGLQWAGGLPGTVGGAVRGNAGAFGGEIRDTLTLVRALTPEGELRTYHNHECAFGYRDSAFKRNGNIILEASFGLAPGEKRALRAEVEEHKSYRRARHPLEYPNAGSTFKNVPVEQVPPSFLAEFSTKVKHDPFPVMPVAVIIAAAGLKGFRIGDAQVSEKHTNYIVNLGKATYADVTRVIAHVKQTIKAKYGIALEEEILVL
ncbi:UDP-N-acetylmuramate dehydrogenase [Candidatus Berkelbacteria bacterium]|nr:UDP-N-acetylmuramate dehydrogenase [Candidatus Berkelbacteria bacterium]